MQDQNEQSLILLYSESLFGPGGRVRLTWSPNGVVRLIVEEISSSHNAGDILFSLQASEIKKSLLADGDSTLYLWISNNKYTLTGGLMSTLENLQEQQFSPDAYIVDNIIDGATEVMKSRSSMLDFQKYLKQHGVKTEKSSLIKILMITTAGFIVFIVLAFVLLLEWSNAATQQ